MSISARGFFVQVSFDEYMSVYVYDILLGQYVYMAWLRLVDVSLCSYVPVDFLCRSLLRNICLYVYDILLGQYVYMAWLRLVGSLKL